MIAKLQGFLPRPVHAEFKSYCKRKKRTMNSIFLKEFNRHISQQDNAITLSPELEAFIKNNPRKKFFGKPKKQFNLNINNSSIFLRACSRYDLTISHLMLCLISLSIKKQELTA